MENNLEFLKEVAPKINLEFEKALENGEINVATNLNYAYNWILAAIKNLENPKEKKNFGIVHEKVNKYLKK